jgi:hypothetical protein
MGLPMKFDLEQDLLASAYIKDKCKNSDTYSQNLYAALCNNRFFKEEYEWTCSWRMSGGIVADIRDVGENYMNWYCSGIACDHITEYVPESIVTEEIREDLLKLGWTIKPYEPRLKPGIYRNDWGSYDSGK